MTRERGRLTHTAVPRLHGAALRTQEAPAKAREACTIRNKAAPVSLAGAGLHSFQLRCHRVWLIQQVQAAPAVCTMQRRQLGR